MTGKLITIGIKPDFPSTGYGYIHCGPDKYMDLSDVYEALNFIEKPDSDKAKILTESGEYLWNSGIFIWKLSTILDNLKRYMPKLYNAFIGIRDVLGTKSEEAALEAVYSEIQSISIDYGILERSADILTIRGEFGWNDIGNWDALQAVIPGDRYGNIVKANYIGIGTTESIIYGSDRLITSVGLNNIIIVDTADALLVCSKDKTQDVKGLVEEIMKRGLEQYL
jgi:mannose-1-phosphate guanylyltransferase